MRRARPAGGGKDAPREQVRKHGAFLSALQPGRCPVELREQDCKGRVGPTPAVAGSTPAGMLMQPEIYLDEGQGASPSSEREEANRICRRWSTPPRPSACRWKTASGDGRERPVHSEKGQVGNQAPEGSQTRRINRRAIERAERERERRAGGGGGGINVEVVMKANNGCEAWHSWAMS